jgi:hypothetical protein
LKAGVAVPAQVFTSEALTPYDGTNVLKSFRAVLRKAKIREIRFHDLRHSYSIINLLERSSNGDGGAGLVFDFYTRDIPWYAYSEKERWIMNRTIRVFRKNLIDAGFLPDSKAGEEVER